MKTAIMSLLLFSFTARAELSTNEVLLDKAFTAAKSGGHLAFGRELEKQGLLNLSATEYLEAASSKESAEAALTALFGVADKLDDEAFLNFTLAKGEQLSVAKTGEFIFRAGEKQLLAGSAAQAAVTLASVPAENPRYFKAQYLLSIAQTKLQKTEAAIATLKALATARAPAGEADYNRNVALAGLARLYYKSQNWDKALEYYRQIPKDSELWHDVLAEIGWTYFRLGEFRAVLGGLSSLHSPYYEDYFLVESVLLRSFVYLSICSIDEMEKTLNLFSKMFFPLRDSVAAVLGSTPTYSELFSETESSVGALHGASAKNLRIPLPLARTIEGDGSFKRSYRRVMSLRGDLRRIEKGSPEFRATEAAKSGAQYLKSRLKEAEKIAGRAAKAHLEAKEKEFESLFRQYDFAKYEMISAQKQSIRQEQSPDSPRATTVDDVDRGFFLDQGVEFYAFRGEYWLDEIGNSHFIGRSRCGEK